MVKAGTITLILGTLYSGKSTKLLQDLERSLIAKKKILLIRPKLDSRDFISRVFKIEQPIEIKYVESSLSEIENIKEYDKIYIDEFQFLPKEIVEEINSLTFLGISFIISALQASAQQHMFESVLTLLPYAEFIHKQNSICSKCGDENATLGYRIDGFTGNCDVCDASVVEDSKTPVKYGVICKTCFGRLFRKFPQI